MTDMGQSLNQPRKGSKKEVFGPEVGGRIKFEEKRVIIGTA